MRNLNTRCRQFAGLILLAAVGCGGPVSRPAEKATKSTAAEAPASEAPLPKLAVNSLGMKLALIPAGEFLMGSAESAPGAREDEQPQHRVRISKPFYLGVYEVTQGEFEQVMGENLSSFSRTGLLKDCAGGVGCFAIARRQRHLVRRH